MNDVREMESAAYSSEKIITKDQESSDVNLFADFWHNTKPNGLPWERSLDFRSRKHIKFA